MFHVLEQVRLSGGQTKITSFLNSSCISYFPVKR
jgi:hypothetical protein